VLTMPVQATAQREGKHYAYVQTDAGVERREVTVGENNEKYIEVKDGVSEGEQLLLDARARNTAEMKAEEAKNPQANPQGVPKSELGTPK
jgi:multidrug efflux pump subunit AcrA (membrane-fusion protein)